MMAERTGQRDDLSGHFESRGGPQFNGNLFEGPVNIAHASSDPTTLYKECFRDLRATDPRVNKRRIESSKDDLLECSCSWVLNDVAFQNWWTQDDPHLLWIHGDPGKGKTMMMLSLYSEVSTRIKATGSGAVVSYFFCQSTDDRLNHAVAVLRGLIFLLVVQDKRTLAPYLRESLDEASDLEDSSNLLYALFQILIDLSIKSKFSKVYLMIDALDECNLELRPLLKEITRSAGHSQKIKWLLTSRNETIIKESLYSRDRPCLSLELNSEPVCLAVEQFVREKVAHLAEVKGYGFQLKAEVEGYLLERADVRHNRQTWEFPAGLEPLYERILDQLSTNDNGQHPGRNLQVLRLITIALRPLHLKEIIALGDLLPERVHDLQDAKDLVDLCGSFLTVRDGIIYFVHQSAIDFFKAGRGSRILIQGESHAHGSITNQCLDLMSSNLRRNICKLSIPDASPQDLENEHLEKNLPLFVQYSVRYWVEHLSRSCLAGEGWHGDKAKLLSFLQTFFLNWLEALSLMKSITDAVSMIGLLQEKIRSHTLEPLPIFLSDARRFTIYHIAMIESAPLQLYSSAIIFSPQTSVIRKQFQNQGPRWISLRPTVPNNCSTSQILGGHSGEVNAVTFSPDGLLVASASDDNTVRIWDTQTVSCRRILKGHSSLVTAVVFSPDGQVVASASSDYTVRLWDAYIGTLQSTLLGHSGPITAVAFSPDSQIIASASHDKTVRLWDTQTGTLRSILNGHFSSVKAVAFSPDGHVVASASNDNTVRLWDIYTGTLRGLLLGHSNRVTAVAFSLDSQVVVSVSEDTTVRLWDTQTSTLRSTFEGHYKRINAVAFSPDDQTVASASDETVRLWNVRTGSCERILKANTIVKAVTFSPDGRLVASASADLRVQLWNTQTGTIQNILEIKRYISYLYFSSDGLYLQTSRGRIDLEIPVRGSIQTTNRALLYSLSPDDCWVVWNGYNVLWLPHEYRPISVGFHEHTLVMGHSSGQVTIIQFRPCTHVSQFC